jgi:hypothetical protein
MADAFPPGMRVTDNLLLKRRLIPGPDTFLIQVEVIAAAMALATFAALAIFWLRRRTRSAARGLWPAVGVPTLLTLLAVAFMMSFLSAPLWRILPALWVVQFPWRLLFVLSVCGIIALGLALDGLPLGPITAVVSALAISTVMAFAGFHQFRARCDAGDLPAAVFARLQRHHTPEPTDEYIPAAANPGSFRPDNPPFWLAAHPQDYAPGTTPNTIDIDPSAPMPAVPASAHLDATPLRFSVVSPAPAFVVVNLENYPNWKIMRDGRDTPDRVHRSDGLIVIAIPAGVSSIAIAWHDSWDERLGWAITLFTLLVWVVARLRQVSARSRAVSVPRRIPA